MNEKKPPVLAAFNQGRANFPVDVIEIILTLPPKSIVLVHVLHSLGFFVSGKLEFTWQTLKTAYPLRSSDAFWRSALEGLEASNLVEVEFNESTRLHEIRRPFVKNSVFHEAVAIIQDKAFCEWALRRWGPANFMQRVRYCQYRIYVDMNVDAPIPWAMKVFSDENFTEPKYTTNFQGFGLVQEREPVATEKEVTLDPARLHGECIKLWDALRTAPGRKKDSTFYTAPAANWLTDYTKWPRSTIDDLLKQWFETWQNVVEMPLKERKQA